MLVVSRRCATILLSVAAIQILRSLGDVVASCMAVTQVRCAAFAAMVEVVLVLVVLVVVVMFLVFFRERPDRPRLDVPTQTTHAVQNNSNGSSRVNKHSSP